MLPFKLAAAAVALTLTVIVGSAEAEQGCGNVDLTGEHFGACSPNKPGPIPGTLEGLLQSLDGRLPRLLRDQCTEDVGSACDCIVRSELLNCWFPGATQTPLMRWFADQGIVTSEGTVELLIVWLKRRIHGQDLRIREEIARYLAGHKKREADYNLGVGSGHQSWPLGTRNDPDGFMDMGIGEDVPRYERFYAHMFEHAEKGLVDCWRRIPLRHPGFHIDVSLWLSLVPETGKWTARVAKSTLPPQYSECMARAVSGVELPDYAPGPYEVTISGVRETLTRSLSDDDPLGSSRDHLLWIAVGVGLATLVTAVLLVRRRLRGTSKAPSQRSH